MKTETSNGNNGKDERSAEPPAELELIEMGKFYFLAGKYQEAKKEFNNALEINPNNPEIYFNLGVTSEACNEVESAKKVYEKAIKLDPAHKRARERLDKLIGL